MTPKDFPHAIKYVAPKGQEDSVFSMYAAHIDGNSISCWTMTDEELEHINNTREVWLNIMGPQPPVLLMAESPISEKLEYTPNRLDSIGKIMDILKSDAHRVMLGVQTQVMTLTHSEFERAIESLPCMKNETYESVKKVAQNVDTICVGIVDGKMLIVRR